MPLVIKPPAGGRYRRGAVHKAGYAPAETVVDLETGDAVDGLVLELIPAR